MTRFNRNRRGLSLMETMFALGVLLVGLLGITAVLSTAGKQAVDSRVLAASQSIAHSSLSASYARDLQNPSNWYFSEIVRQPTSGNLENRWLPASPTLPASFCLDPIGISSQNPLEGLDLTAPDPPNQFEITQYDRGLFPYYKSTANPLVNPSIAINAPEARPWGDMARMRRITLGTTIGMMASVIAAKRVEQIFASADELSVVTSDADKSLPATLNFEFVPGTPIQVPLGRSSTKQEFSWFATFTPNELATPSNMLYTMSIVVVRNRDRKLEIPVANGAGDSRSNPSAECIAWLIPLGNSGQQRFQNGGGGRALMVMSQFVEPHIASGNWVMLSRIGDDSQPNFGWFRISYVDPEPTLMAAQLIPTRFPVQSPIVDPFGRSVDGLPVSVREVHLSGRDWQFWHGLSSTPPKTGSQSTMVTIVRGAVQVHERVVSLAVPSE